MAVTTQRPLCPITGHQYNDWHMMVGGPVIDFALRPRNVKVRIDAISRCNLV